MDYLETMLVYTLGNILLPGTSKRRLTFGNTTVVSWKEEVKYNEVVMSSWSTFQRKREKYQKKKKKIPLQTHPPFPYHSAGLLFPSLATCFCIKKDVTWSQSLKRKQCSILYPKD